MHSKLCPSIALSPSLQMLHTPKHIQPREKIRIKMRKPVTISRPPNIFFCLAIDLYGILLLNGHLTCASNTLDKNQDQRMERQYFSDKKFNRPRKIYKDLSSDAMGQDSMHMRRFGEEKQQVFENERTTVRFRSEAQILWLQALLNFAKQRSGILILAFLLIISMFFFSDSLSKEECFQLYKQLKCEHKNLTEECHRYFVCFQDQISEFSEVLNKVKKALIGFILALILKLCHRYLHYWRMIFE